MNQHNPRAFGSFLVVLGALTFVCLSSIALYRASDSLLDFGHVYCSARCVLEHRDPYNPAEVLRVYHKAGVQRPSDSDDDRRLITRNLYFPTEFLITVPFGLLPYSLAKALWVALTGAGVIFATFLMYDLAADYAPEPAGWLLCFLLANAEQLVLYGNPAGIAIPLCLIAVWCFVREKFVFTGICCLAASLALKPHDVGMVWLFFLLARGAYRRRAMLALVIMGALSVPVILWVAHLAPNWIGEMHANWIAVSFRGGAADPGPTSFMLHGTGRITDLQSVFSVFHDDPSFYNWAAYLICGPLLIFWMIITLRARLTTPMTFLALAAIAPLSMLPFYHRIYDAKIVMLAVPACALLWAEGGRIGRYALAVTTAGCVVTADLPWSAYIRASIKLHLLTRTQPGVGMSAAMGFPLPLILLLMGVFYLWVYAKRSARLSSTANRLDS